MSFEKYVPMRKPSAPPKISLLVTGMFWVSPKAKELFQDYKRVFLLYDRERKVVRFEPTNEKKNSFSLSLSSKRRDATISGISFCEHFRIKHTETKSYEAIQNKEEGVVEINLRSPI